MRCDRRDGGCDGASAYVVGPWGDDINVCNSYFNNGYSISMQAGILIHELSHAYNDTADCYRAFTQDFFMP